MIVAAALCPAPPLLVRELTGAQQVAPDLVGACLESVAELMAANPDVIAVVGTAPRTEVWNGEATLDLARYAPGLYSASGQPAGHGLPQALGVGRWLLATVGCQVSPLLQAVAEDEPAARCAEIGAALACTDRRVALLAMADGSARRGLKAPGYLDERSVEFDAAVERAVRTGELGPLLSIDESVARELMATGRPAWQVLAGAMGGRPVATQVRYCDDPFGVAYLVASLRAGRNQSPGSHDG